jgi:hypothetical protein
MEEQVVAQQAVMPEVVQAELVMPSAEVPQVEQPAPASYQLQDCPKDICPPITMTNNDGHQITFKYCQLLETLRIAKENFTTCKDEIIAEVEDALQSMGINQDERRD